MGRCPCAPYVEDGLRCLKPRSLLGPISVTIKDGEPSPHMIYRLFREHLGPRFQLQCSRPILRGKPVSPTAHFDEPIPVSKWLKRTAPPATIRSTTTPS